MSLNIVKGCNGPNGKRCPYCYACRFVKRLGFAEKIAEKEMIYLYGEIEKHRQPEYENLVEKIKSFKPHFFNYVYAQPLRKKPTIYFFSMSDPAYWKQEWYEKILKRIMENMQHTFVILTKQPGIYRKYTFPHNTILGITCTKQKEVDKLPMYSNALGGVWSFFNETINNKLLLSIEPIQEKIILGTWARETIDWIHVGQESGNRKGRIKTTREMIQPIYDLKGIPVFMKDNLDRLFPGQLRKEFPKI